MTDLNFEEFDDILRQLAESRSSVEAMVDAILLAESSALMLTAYYCAIPRYFSADLIVALSEYSISDIEANKLLESMKTWGFVEDIGGGEFVYRQEVRQYFRAKLQKDDSLKLTSLNQRAYTFFYSKLPAKSDVNEQVWLNLSISQVDALRESIYHLIQYDPENGFELFRKMFSRAIQLHLVEETFTLIKFIKQLDNNIFSPMQRLELIYFDAVQDHLDKNIESAENKLKKIISQSTPNELQARALTELGKVHFGAKRFDAAIQSFQDAQKIWVALNLPRQSATLSNNIGNAYLAKGEYQQAERNLLHSLSSLEKINALTEQARALNNLGNLYRAQDEWDKARQFYEKSLHIKNSLGDRYGVAITQLNLGRWYQQLARDIQNNKQEKEYRQHAKDNFTQSLNTFRHLGAHSNQALALFSLAGLLHQEGRSDEARQTLNEAIKIFSALEMTRELEMSKKIANQWSVPH